MSTGAERCSELSRAAGEPLAATATTAERWLLVEVPGTWPRDVAEAGTLPERAHEAVSAWLATTPRSKALFVRRPGRSARSPLVFVVRSEESVSETRRIEIDAHEDLASVDLDRDGESCANELALVCGHGSRDACCALRGTAVFTALSDGFGEEELWISSHHGGHRFAANILVLPLGVHLGRLEADDAPRVLETALAGRIELGHYRGRTWYESRVQAGEHAIREFARLDGVRDLRLLDGEDSVVRFEAVGGNEYAAAVEETEGPIVPASCGAEPAAQPVFKARVV